LAVHPAHLFFSFKYCVKITVRMSGRSRETPATCQAEGKIKAEESDTTMLNRAIELVQQSLSW